MESTQTLQLLKRPSFPSRLVFIDPTVEDYQSLAVSVLPDTEVVILNTERDGVEQISEILTQRTGITSLHFVSHGAPGRVYLGNTQLGQHTLKHYARQLMNWADALSADAQILLYGCDVAQTPLGKTFVQCLSELTGAVVLASDDKTGSAALGGDWELEVTTASSTATVAFESATLEAYGEVLAKPYLIKDIFLGSSSSKISELTNVNGTVYFVADDGIHGPELWKSDGTKQGTVLVKDIYLGSENYRVSKLTYINDTLYFAANDGANYYVGDKLWKTDGTEAGTVIVKGIDYGFLSRIDSLVNFDGILYFGFDDGNHRTSEDTNDLWKTDGTPEGTVKVKDLGNQGFFAINSFLNVNGTLFFNIVITDGGGTFSLWKSDGTEEGTIQLYNQVSILLTGINDTLYFSAGDTFDIENDIIGLELWKSDGTKEGTVLVKDINPGSSGSFPSNAIDFNGILYFSANDGTHGAELWKSDGTAEGTVLVKDINVGFGNSAPSNLTNINNTLYFVANDGTHGAELWKSDGTAEGTILVKDINVGSGDSTPSSLINVNGTLYFVANNGIHGSELWKSDGTAEGTVLVAHINPGSGSSDISDLNYFDGILYFLANDGIYGKELWALNINSAVTSPVISITAIDANAAEASNDPAVFRISRSGDTSTALIVKYNIDGTAINGKDYNQLNGTITIAAGQSFVDITITPADEILKEGSETVTLTLFNQSYYAVDQSQITATAVIADNVNTAVVPTQLYLVKDIIPGNSNYIGADITNLTNVNGTLYFTANDGIYGQELWKSDGTPEGTVLIKDIKPGAGGSYPYNLTNINNTLYFFADGTNGYELWKSDGTPEGTVLVEDPESIDLGSSAMININGIFYFIKDDDIYGKELWKSDGTVEGTVLVKDINPGASDSFVNSEEYPYLEPELINFKDTLYFFANDGTNGYELWKSDGTVEGTVLVKDINPGSFGSSPSQDFNYNTFPRDLTVVNDILYFAADDGIHGTELWASDGTTEGTVLVKDAIPGAADFFPSNLTNVDGILYFTADDRVNGRELWALNTNTSPFISTVSITATDANAIEAGSSPGILRISRTGNADIALAVKYTIGGTAANGNDYNQLTGIAAFAVGQSFVEISITPPDDNLVEGIETLIIALTTGSDYEIDASAASATVKIADKAFNIVSVTAIDDNAAEAENDPSTFRISRSGEIDTALIVKYTVSGTATNGDDYNQLNGTVTIAAGESFVDISITPVDDIFIEGSETVTLTIASVSDYDIDPSLTAATVVIADNTKTAVVRQPYLVKDINPGSGSSGDTNYFLNNINGVLYFNANDGVRGQELWTSDGTETGTILFKDINPGSGYSHPYDITDVDGIFYFEAFNGTSNGLWKSDGTVEGTVLVKKDISVSLLTNVNGILYFSGFDNTSDRSLWKSDGTEAGTVLVKSITPYGGSLLNLTSVDNMLFFFGNDNTHGLELWKSDGTEAGTVLVKDINPGSESSVSYGYQYNPSINGILYFIANDGTHGKELWRSDGTAKGTILVKDINPGSGDSVNDYSNPVKVNDTFYFGAFNGTSSGLWKSDGTAAGTVLVKKDISFYKGTNVNGILYFLASDSTHGEELWKSDGTEAGTFLVKDINPGSNSSSSSDLIEVNGIVYFKADDGIHGRELWQSDGTEAGTFLVKDINFGSNSSYPDRLTNVDGTLYFTADDGIHGKELWALNPNSSAVKPTVSITVIDVDATETDTDPALFRISRTGDTNIALAVKYTISGTAINGSDYTQLTGIASFAVSQSFVDIYINPKDDGIAESSETVTLTLATDEDYNVDTFYTSATVAIADRFNFINGDGSRDLLIGTDGSDRIFGGTGSKTIAGGAGFDEFVYTNIREVGHRISDFTVGEDKIVLTQLLDSLVSGGYNGTDAIADGYVRLVQGSTANSTIVQIDRDATFGSAIFRPLIELDNVTPQAVNNVSNFVF